MNEREASRVATLIAKRWPAHIQATVNVPINREDDQGYSVQVAIPREHRVLRLGREAQLPGILDVCTALMTPDDVPLPIPTQTIYSLEEEKEEKAMSIELMEQQEQECEMFTEEEAATYLGVKPVTVRAYANNETLHRQTNGGFLLEELRHYKEARDARGRVSKTAPILPAEEVAMPADPPVAPRVQVVPIPNATHESYVEWPERVSRPAQEEAATPLTIGVPVPVLPPVSERVPSEEERLLQALIAHAFAHIPGIRGLGRLSEIPRSWKVDLMTERGPESYRITRDVDGSLQQERW